MELGINLSFAVKRWTSPESLADMCASLGPTKFQISLDQIDPWWPEQYRDAIAAKWLEAFGDRGLQIVSVFGGMAGYSFPQNLAPMPEQRAASMEYFKRALDTTRALGAVVYGSPVGGMDVVDFGDEAKRSERYAELIERYRELAAYGASIGIEEIMIEPTPIEKEFLYTPEACLKFLDDLGETAIPVRYLVDWGHALCEPWSARNSMLEWCQKLGEALGGLHIQQTDGKFDRHWAFDQPGLVTRELVDEVVATCGLDDMVQYLEVMPAYESPDDQVLESVKATVAFFQ